MSRAKVLISISIVLLLIALSGASVWAAPGKQEPTEPTTISGEVQDITIEVDEETGATTVLVTLLVDETTGDTQTVRLSLETALALGLVEEDAEGNPIVNEDMIGETVEIDPEDVIEEDGEETLHPVALALADFFADTLGLDYDLIMSYHEDGMGFGVIAQACWMSLALEGDTTLLGDILAAKKSGDFSSIELPDGETVTNWGQFRKAVLSSDKAQHNLGAIMSGRAGKEREQEQEQEGAQGTEATTHQNQGKGKGHSSDEECCGPPAEPPGKSKEGKEGEPSAGPHGKDKDKGDESSQGGPPAEPHGKSNSDENGGPPAEPPGKDKGGGHGKGGGKGK